MADFAARRQTDGLQVSSINSSLRVLRRVLKLAVEWGALGSSPRVKLLTGERHRERVVNTDEEARYLAAAPEPLASVAAILCDTGLRPEECFRLRWEAITWVNGRHGTLLVTHGKTASARRVLPMTPRVRSVLEPRWESVGKPLEGWVWAAPTRSGHMESSSLKRQHKQVFKVLAEQTQRNNQKPFRRFVLYSLRHTFLTRLGELGCDAWTLARIAGYKDFCSIRTPVRGRGVHCDDKAGWAQNWARRESGGFLCNDATAANTIETNQKDGGRDRDRTGDPLLAKQVLSQLSYTPKLI
jgi:integrase